jgi:galactokinase
VPPADRATGTDHPLAPAGEAGLARRVLAAFRERTGGEPDGLWRAPGRANLIGEHTDYNEGFALPFALDRSVVVAVRRRPDDLVRLSSLGVGEVRLRLADVRPGGVTGWAAYVAGPAWALAEDGVAATGLDVVLGSDVPVGAGLSSSAAVQCAVALALDDLAGRGSDRTHLARVVQRSENVVVGAPVGLLDQMASLHARRGNALGVDFRTLAVRHLPLRPADAGLALLVLDTRVAHAHVTGSYAERRRACEAAARVLGVPALRDATPADVAAAAGRLGDLLPVARHVAGEDARVLAAAALLQRGDLVAVGPLLSASHASLRDDLAVSCPELDSVVGAAAGAGALGARMMGGGFGGSAVALVRADDVAAVTVAVLAAARERGFPEPQVITVHPDRGASRLRLPAS